MQRAIIIWFKRQNCRFFAGRLVSLFIIGAKDLRETIYKVKNLFGVIFTGFSRHGGEGVAE